MNPRAGNDMLSPIRKARYWAQQVCAEGDLSRIRLAEPMLSRDDDLDRVISELETRLDRFKADVDSGRYSGRPGNKGKLARAQSQRAGSSATAKSSSASGDVELAA